MTLLRIRWPRSPQVTSTIWFISGCVWYHLLFVGIINDFILATGKQVHGSPIAMWCNQWTKWHRSVECLLFLHSAACYWWVAGFNYKVKWSYCLNILHTEMSWKPSFLLNCPVLRDTIGHLCTCPTTPDKHSRAAHWGKPQDWCMSTCMAVLLAAILASVAQDSYLS